MAANTIIYIISPEILARAQYSEIKRTTSTPPFGEWWDNSIEILTYWDEIQKMIDRQKELYAKNNVFKKAL